MKLLSLLLVYLLLENIVLCKDKSNSRFDNSDDSSESLKHKLFFSGRNWGEGTFNDRPWNFSLLNKHLQSPVDILTAHAEKRLYPKPLKFSAVNDKSITSTITNSGHGVAVIINSTNDAIKPRLYGSFLEDDYIFENLHFHWGKADYFGSEHFINGESYSMEGHMVMIKKEYGDINRALMYKDGICALTFFAKVGNENKYFNRLLRHIPKIIEGESSVEVPSADPLLWFVPDVVAQNRYSNYLAYPGSLTTPPFSESVTFIIMPKPITVSSDQLATLRRLKDGKSQPVTTNRRELQPLRGRPLISLNRIQWNIKTTQQRKYYPPGAKTAISYISSKNLE